MRATRALASAKALVSSNPPFRSFPHGSSLDGDCGVSVVELGLTTVALSGARVVPISRRCPDLPRTEFISTLAYRKAVRSQLPDS